MSHSNNIPRPFMTDAVARVRKPLPFESLGRVLATYFYMQRDMKNFDGFDLNLLAPDRYITSEERSQAPILAFLEMGKLSGNRQDVEHPGFVGSKYIGDLQTPSEIGIATLDLRRCFSAIDDSRFRHAKSPGAGGQDWAFDRKILERRHLVCVEDLAIDADRRGQAGPASMGAFSKSEFIPRRHMMGRLVQLLRDIVMQDVRGHARASRTASADTMTAGDPSVISTINGPRPLLIMTWDAKSVIAQLDACQLDFVDHCNPDSPVLVIDMQQSFQWSTNDTIGSFTTRLGVYPRPNPSITLSNAGNSSFLSALGFLKHTFMTQEEFSVWERTPQSLCLLPAPIDTTRNILRSNRTKATAATQDAISNKNSLRIDAIECARVQTGLLRERDRTFKQTATGLERTRSGAPPIAIEHYLTPAQESADGGQKFYHPVYVAGYLGHDISAVHIGDNDKPSKMMFSFYPEATRPSYMRHLPDYHEHWETERQKRLGLR